MSNNQPQAISLPLPVSFFYGWVIIALTFISVLMAAGIRAAPQTFIKPLEADFGWGRAAIASAVAVNLLLYGAIGLAVIGVAASLYGVMNSCT